MVPTALVAAAGGATKAPPFDIWNLIQFGLLGVAFVCLVTGKFIVTEREMTKAEARHGQREAELKADNDRLRGQVEKLQALTEEQTIPSLTRATEIVARYTEELQRERLRRDARDGRA